MASISSCLVLSFRAIAKASKLEWSSIECKSQGTLDKTDKKVHCTHVLTKVKLTIPLTQNSDAAIKLLNKAEQICFVSNSMSCSFELECEIISDNV